MKILLISCKKYKKIKKSGNNKYYNIKINKKIKIIKNIVIIK